VIKPIVLHGRSRLHPLLALLSVLGGVKALGPIGILVGPMVVSFLQAVMTMLNRELDRMGSEWPPMRAAPASAGEGDLASSLETPHHEASPDAAERPDMEKEPGAEE